MQLSSKKGEEAALAMVESALRDNPQNPRVLVTVTFASLYPDKIDALRRLARQAGVRIDYAPV